MRLNWFPIIRESIGAEAMADLEEMLIKENQKENEVQPKYESGEKNRINRCRMYRSRKQKPTGVRQSVLAALRERQAKQKAQEQKEEQKAERKPRDTGRTGDMRVRF